MLYTLLIICIIIFIIYHFYVDYRNWSNVGGDFAEGMTNNVCMTEEECKKVAESLGLKLGGHGYPFAGNWETKGLYAYKTGKYAGMAFFGTGGTEEQMKVPPPYPTSYRPVPPTSSEEQITGNGSDYRGKQNRTRSGRVCQNWTSQSPHKHSNTPEKKPNKGLGDHNYCRNPDGESSIWCYTEDSSKRWELCDPLKNNEDEDKVEEQPQDNNSIVLVDDNFKKPIKNNVIDLKSFKMGKDYELEFIIKPLGKVWGWSNILHNTFTGQNCCRVGDRYPAIWFWSNTTRMHIICGAKGSSNWNTGDNPNYNLPINKESTVNIRLQNNIFSVRITDQNGKIVYQRNQTVKSNKPPKYITEEQSKFYFSDPWYRSSNVQIKNMMLINLDPKPVDATADLMKQLSNNNDVTNGNQLNQNLLNSLLNNSNTNNIPDAQKLQIIQSLQQQHQLPRQVIQILQPPRQIHEPMANTAVGNSINSLNTGDQMLQSLPNNVSLQPQSIPRISDFTLFNEDIMKKVLSNKNLIPNDVKVGMESKENYIRIGKNFMIEVSKIRNLALPNIEQDDYEKIGRIASKIYIKNNNNVSLDSINVTQNSLISVVNNILKGGDEINSENSDNQQTSQSSLLRDPNNTTGMFSNNKNKHLSSQNNESSNEFKNVNKTKYINNARISKSDLKGSLCMWDGCEASGKKPYDSIYSIF